TTPSDNAPDGLISPVIPSFSFRPSTPEEGEIGSIAMLRPSTLDADGPIPEDPTVPDETSEDPTLSDNIWGIVTNLSWDKPPPIHSSTERPYVEAILVPGPSTKPSILPLPDIKPSTSQSTE
ncbi:unnamed protein product, partial [Meganyctiphanes norvegica]